MRKINNSNKNSSNCDLCVALTTSIPRLLLFCSLCVESQSKRCYLIEFAISAPERTSSNECSPWRKPKNVFLRTKIKLFASIEKLSHSVLMCAEQTGAQTNRLTTTRYFVISFLRDLFSLRSFRLYHSVVLVYAHKHTVTMTALHVCLYCFVLCRWKAIATHSNTANKCLCATQHPDPPKIHY